MSDTKNTKPSLFLRIVNNNKAVFTVSLIVALIAWVFVSASQTTEVEKTFTNVKVQLNLEGSMPDNNGLELFGDDEIYVDVSVKGKSYIVNSSDFADNIVVSLALGSVSTAGTYSLPITADINNISSSDAEITNLSKSTVSLYFDENVEKVFELNIDIDESSEKYKLPDGYVRENPRLSADKVTLCGPALEIARISSVNAHVVLDKEITSTETLEAEIVPVGTGEGSAFPNVTVKETEPFYVTVPVSYISEFKPVISFTGMPKSLKEKGVEYTVSPSKVKVNVQTADKDLIKSGEITVGSVDFSKINNTVNEIKISTEGLSFTFPEGISSFTAVIDMSSMDKRWIEIPVSLDGVELPDGAELIDETVKSVQVVGPHDSVYPIETGELLAIPVLDGIKLKSGENTVPVKITLRTLTDSWVYGEYSVRINVK